VPKSKMYSVWMPSKKEIL